MVWMDKVKYANMRVLKRCEHYLNILDDPDQKLCDLV